MKVLLVSVIMSYFYSFIALAGAAFPIGPASPLKSSGCPSGWSICPSDSTDTRFSRQPIAGLKILDQLHRGDFPIDTDIIDWQDAECQPKTLSQYLHCVRNHFKAEYVKYDIVDPVLFERGPPKTIDTAVTFLATENVAIKLRVETLEADLLALTARVAALEE